MQPWGRYFQVQMLSKAGYLLCQHCFTSIFSPVWKNSTCFSVDWLMFLLFSWSFPFCWRESLSSLSRKKGRNVSFGKQSLSLVYLEQCKYCTFKYKKCISPATVFVRMHHNHCAVNVCVEAKIHDTIVPGPAVRLIDESRRAVFKCVSANTVRPV